MKKIISFICWLLPQVVIAQSSSAFNSGVPPWIAEQKEREAANLETALKRQVLESAIRDNVRAQPQVRMGDYFNREPSSSVSQLLMDTLQRSEQEAEVRRRMNKYLKNPNWDGR